MRIFVKPWIGFLIITMGSSFSPALATNRTPILSLPQIDPPPAGDPRLEPIPGVPIHLANFNVLGTDVVGNSVKLTMRFPPRVNGQTQSDGDKHADMFVLFYADTGRRVRQLPIVEAVPKPLTNNDLKARQFSAIWELHAVLVDRKYNPNNPAFLIDSAAKVESSAFVHKIVQTNIFLNCPIVPDGTTIDPVPGGPVANEPKVMDAFFEGQVIHFVPYDIEDGGFNPQILFMFKDQAGNILTNPSMNPGISNPPHLVASKAPGEPFYSSIWELWVVRVPNGTDVTKITSAAQVRSLFPLSAISSTGIRLNCPVVAIDGRAFPFEDAFALLDGLLHSGGSFAPWRRTPIHLPEAEFTPSRTFLITEINDAVIGPPAPPPPSTSTFPSITPDDKGNVIPVILKDPFQITGPGPNTTGERIRFNQTELGEAFLTNNPPRLPEGIETNVQNLIDAGLLAPDWAPGGRPYQERLGTLVGRAIFEMVWRPEDGGNQKDVTSCLACHSQPASGGAARGLYSLRRDSDRGGKVNAGSMWGGGGAELLRTQLIALDEQACNPPGTNNPPGCTTFAHGSVGNIASLRGVVSGAFNTHMGMQSSEFVSGPVTVANGKAKCDLDHNGTVSVAEAKSCDLDGDGVAEELSVAEVTAVTAFLAGQPVPRQANDDIIETLLGFDPQFVQRGGRLFRESIDRGGANCASCHTPFRPLSGTTLNIPNPETTFILPIDVSRHSADELDVSMGLADAVGENGLRIYGDFKLHKMGLLMKNNGIDVMKTAELWDAGSVFPWGRAAQWGGTQLRDVILAHNGVSLTNMRVSRRAQLSSSTLSHGTVSSQEITITNRSSNPILASPTEPIRVVLTGHMSQGIEAANVAGRAPDGSLRQGAFWLITETIPAGGSAKFTAIFKNPFNLWLQFGLTIQDHAGFSEAVASAVAFRSMWWPERWNDQKAIMAFLRAQLVGGKVGEGSGLVPPPPTMP